MKTKIAILGLLFCILTSCENNKDYPNIKKANWVIGNWTNTSPQGKLVESWQKTNDSVYNGESFFIKEKDTLFGEYVKLIETNGKLTYIVTVSGQNNDKPVRFEMTSITDSQIVFENPEHDFPNKIVYNNISKDSLVAEVSGMRNGKPDLQKFKMVRQ
ncbi:MAG: hypothetical protein BM557_08500 [Flavobacterium sp. MedPE-SWcel]|uniref:DUF6265 family protein n=1 Tax=uncultured Flavobacterium sp. TaxID=165435 RepID=UPI00090F8C1B|nr:DUF6265 family protein [uncultured Flavobacterium sp.]OIQ17243.1 MAG: hypothetical protein BM557_08500 [Flavobacterium sp. MedPE-SWcel]